MRRPARLHFFAMNGIRLFVSATSSDKYQVAKVAAFILAQFAQQLAQLGRGVVAQLGFLGANFGIFPPSRSPAQERRGAYEQLSLFSEADAVRTKLSQEFDLVARRLNQGLSQNSFVTLRDGGLHLKRPDAMEVPERVHRLHQTIETRLPRIRIEDLLRDVDKRCGFTRAFRPPVGLRISP